MILIIIREFTQFIKHRINKQLQIFTQFSILNKIKIKNKNYIDNKNVE